VQTPILDAMVARGDIDYLVIAPTDKDQMVTPLQQALESGIGIITVDTFLGDGDYVNGPVTFPISAIGSDNTEGGRISARGLAKAIGGKGKVYINSTNPNVSSVEARAIGFNDVMDNEFPDIEVVGLDFNLDDMNTAVQQTAATLERVPDLAGVFGTNVFSAQGAGTAVVNAGLGGAVQVVAYDATQFAIEQLRDGVVSLVLAQKPFDMGYLAVQFAVADASGVTSIPAAVETGFAIIDIDNVDDPEVARFIYQVPN
ncbi:MAG: substrate-binding domain-containing protein, partial [Lysobacterales bacterium]